MLNIRSINPSASSECRWKYPALKSHIYDYIHDSASKQRTLPFIALTETWLKGYMNDAQLKIPGYDLKRSDRDKRVGGGVLLYAHESIPVSYSAKYDDSTCEVLFCKFDTIKTCVVVVYRPTDAPLSSFKKAINFIYSEVDIV